MREEAGNLSASSVQEQFRRKIDRDAVRVLRLVLQSKSKKVVRAAALLCLDRLETREIATP